MTQLQSRFSSQDLNDQPMGRLYKESIVLNQSAYLQNSFSCYPKCEYVTTCNFKL